jgi:hypothetical protein
MAYFETVDSSGPRAFVRSYLLRDPSLALFENMDVSTFSHFPISCLSWGSLDLKPSAARQEGPWWTIAKALVQEIWTTELMITLSRRMWGSQRKAGTLKLFNILRRTTYVSSLPSRKWSKSPTRLLEWGTPSSGFQTCTDTVNRYN